MNRPLASLHPLALVVLFIVTVLLLIGVLCLGPVSQTFHCSRNAGDRVCEMRNAYAFSGTAVSRFPESSIGGVMVEDSHPDGARNVAPETRVMLELADGTRYPVASYALHGDAGQAAFRLRTYLTDPQAKSFAFGGHPMMQSLLLFAILPLILATLLAGAARLYRRHDARD